MGLFTHFLSDPCTKLIGGGGRGGVQKSYTRKLPDILSDRTFHRQTFHCQDIRTGHLIRQAISQTDISQIGHFIERTFHRKTIGRQHISQANVSFHFQLYRKRTMNTDSIRRIRTKPSNVVNALLHKGFSNPYLSRYNSSAIHVNTNTNSAINVKTDTSS